MAHDIFLSHASEDKETFVKDLYDRLTKAKYKVWYDAKQISWGDKLDDKIQEGLRGSKYGIVVISNNYFAKHKEWTFTEFRKILTTDNILPILHKISMEEIKNEHPQEYELIKNWHAISSEEGINYIVQEAKKKIDNLKSDSDIDYIRLRDQLAAGNWKDANHETDLVMLKVMGREKGHCIRDEELLNFPCIDLHTIDSLWVKYSNERFGFSVQKKIYLEVGGKLDGKYYKEAWKKFGDCVGWRKGWWEKEWIEYSEVTFDTSARAGHLPIGIISLGSFRDGYETPFYLEREETPIWVPLLVLLSRPDL